MNESAFTILMVTGLEDEQSAARVQELLVGMGGVQNVEVRLPKKVHVTYHPRVTTPQLMLEHLFQQGVTTCRP
ncbi:MAG TPA: hypothetical protein GXZ96_08315 [Firmicutes bacterium]|nr:hypothetical protein [Bacillota bacterium]